LQSLKGVGRLIEVYAIKKERLVVQTPDDYLENKIDVHSDDVIPSIAIIPFENKGADEDVFYAYGISADLISDCSGAGLIRVASLKDVEKLDYNNMETSELSEKLLTRYIAQGTLWKMGEMFQLSVELYDTKDKKVVWSDRWQEKWDNLPTIKGSLSDGLLKALDTKPKVEKKIDTANPEAYEFYLKAKHKYEKRENMDDTEIARGLLNKAIELDDNLIRAKTLLGTTYMEMGDYDEAMEIYTPALIQSEELSDKQGMGYSLKSIGNVHHERGDYNKSLDYYGRSLAISEELGDKLGIGNSLNNIGLVHRNKGDYDKAFDYLERSLAIHEELGNKLGMGNCLNNIGIMHKNGGGLDYYDRSLAIREELGDKQGMGNSLSSIGGVHYNKGDVDTALDYLERSLAIAEELGDKQAIGSSLNNIGGVYWNKGDYETALDCYKRSLSIHEELGDKRGMGNSLDQIGKVHYNKGDYEHAIEYLEKSLAIHKEIGKKDFEFYTTIYLYLSYRHLGKYYDVKIIHSLIKETENIGFDLNLRLYELLENKSYLESAYKQVEEKAENLEPDIAAKLLSYPIPKAIVEEWEKVK